MGVCFEFREISDDDGNGWWNRSKSHGDMPHQGINPRLDLEIKLSLVLFAGHPVVVSQGSRVLDPNCSDSYIITRILSVRYSRSG